MHYLIQENTFRESNYDNIILALERLQLPFTVVKIFPYVDKVVDISVVPDSAYEVTDLPDIKIEDKKVFIFGAIKLARIGKEMGWKPGSMLNDSHDFEAYSPYYGENLLNWDSKVVKFSEDFEWKVNEKKFIRPCLDDKVFLAKVYAKDEWETHKSYLLTNGHVTSLTPETRIQVSTPKLISKEIRCWVVDGKVITASQYRLGSRVFNDPNVEQDAIDFAQSMVNLFQLAEVFVIDICLSDQGWKIVECGCVNSAGFYAADLQKLLMSIEDHFDPIDNFGESIDGSHTLGY
jgi:hypothetical protein